MGGDNRPVTNVVVADRLRAGVRLLLRPSGSLPRLSWRGQVFDVIVVLGLLLAAIQAGGDDRPRPPDVGYDQWQPVPVPPGPLREPFLRFEHDQTLSAVVMLLMVLPLVLRRRYPLAVLWIVLGAAPWLSDYDAALRLSFYVCVIAAYTAAVYSPYRVPALASLPVAALVAETSWKNRFAASGSNGI